MIKLGDNNVTLKLGDNDVSKVYLGENQIYPNKKNLKLLTDNAYLEVQNPALLDQLGGLYAEFVLDARMTIDSSRLIRKYVTNHYIGIFNRITFDRLALNYTGGAVYFPKYFRPVGATLWVETRINNDALELRNSEYTNWEAKDFLTYPVPTGGDGALLFVNMRVTILDLKIDGEVFTKSSDSTLTGDLSNVINVIGVEGTDYEWV